MLSQDVNILQCMINIYKEISYGYVLTLTHNCIDWSYQSNEQNVSLQTLTSLKTGHHQNSSFKKGIDKKKCDRYHQQFIETTKWSKKKFAKESKNKIHGKWKSQDARK